MAKVRDRPENSNGHASPRGRCVLKTFGNEVHWRDLRSDETPRGGDTRPCSKLIIAGIARDANSADHPTVKFSQLTAGLQSFTIK